MNNGTVHQLQSFNNKYSIDIEGGNNDLLTDSMTYNSYLGGVYFYNMANTVINNIQAFNVF